GIVPHFAPQRVEIDSFGKCFALLHRKLFKAAVASGELLEEVSSQSAQRLWLDAQLTPQCIDRLAVVYGDESSHAITTLWGAPATSRTNRGIMYPGRRLRSSVTISCPNSTGVSKCAAPATLS